MKLKHNISFSIRPYGKERNLFQIRIRVSYNCQRIDLATGCQINDRSAWDKVNQLVVPGYHGPKGETDITINNTLRNQRDQMEWTFSFFEVNEINPTPDQVSTKYLERLNGTVPQMPIVEKQKKEKPNAEPNFFEVYDLFLAECGEKNAWTKATFEKMEAMRVDFQAFKKNIKFADLTESTLTEFVAYLRDSKVLKTPRRKKGEREDYDDEDLVGLKNSTIEKKLGYLRWFLNWATDKGYNKNLTYKTFRPTLKKTQKKVIYLTKQELDQIRALDLPEEKLYLDPVRDVFLFSCFSGLRHSDSFNLRRNDVKEDHIEVTTMKTADSLTIELNTRTKAILEKYKDIQFPGNKALPVIQNQPMNRDLKELCKLAGINEEIRVTTYKGNERKDEIHPKWELIGTHTGRRTFIVNALSLGIPPNVVMKWTGHSDYKAMKPYIDIVDSTKAESMKKFDTL